MKATSANTGALKVQVVDETGFGLVNALLEFFDGDGRSLGFPEVRTGADGYATQDSQPLIQGVPVGKVTVKASVANQSGEASLDVFPNTTSSAQIILSYTGTAKLKVSVVDAETKQTVSGANVQVADYQNPSSILKTATVAAGPAELEVPSGADVIVKAFSSGYVDYTTSRITMVGDQEITITLSRGTTVTPNTFGLELLGFFTSDGKTQVFHVTPNATYIMKFKLTWPENLEAGGVHIRVGPDSLSDVADMDYWITNISAVGGGAKRFGRTYTPPNGLNADRATTTSSAGKAKWAQVLIANPTASQEVRVPVFISATAVTGNEIEFQYRAWGVTPEGDYLRSPEDPVLGPAQFVEERQELYSDTFRATTKILEVPASCSNPNVCITAFFRDHEGTIKQANQFTPFVGKVNTLVVYAVGKKEGLTPVFNFIAKPGSGLEVSAESSQTLNLALGDVVQKEVTFTATKETQNAWIKVEARSGSEPNAATLAQQQFTFNTAGIKTFSVDAPKFWSQGTIGQLSITVKDSEGNPVNADSITLADHEGKPLSGNPLLLKDFATASTGVYSLNGFAPAGGILKLTVERFGFTPFTSFITVGTQGTFGVKSATIKIPAGSVASLTPIEIKNNSFLDATDVAVSITPQAANSKFKLDVENAGVLDLIPASQSVTIQATANYLGAVTTPAVEQFDVSITGKVGLTGLPAFGSGILTVEHITTLANAKCLELSPSQLKVNLPGKLNVSTQSDYTVKMKNVCSFPLSSVAGQLTGLPSGVKAEAIGAGEGDKFLLFDAIQPGEEQSVSFQFTSEKDFLDNTPINATFKVSFGAGSLSSFTQTVQITGKVWEGNDALQGTPKTLFLTLGSTDEAKRTITITNNTEVSIEDLQASVEEPVAFDQKLMLGVLAENKNTLGPGQTLNLDAVFNGKDLLQTSGGVSGKRTGDIFFAGTWAGQPVEFTIEATVIVAADNCLAIPENLAEAIELYNADGKRSQTVNIPVTNKCGVEVDLDSVLPYGDKNTKDFGRGSFTGAIVGNKKIPLTGATTQVKFELTPAYLSSTGSPKKLSAALNTFTFLGKTLLGGLPREVQSNLSSIEGSVSTAAHAAGALTSIPGLASCDGKDTPGDTSLPKLASGVAGGGSGLFEARAACEQSYCDASSFGKAVIELVAEAKLKAQSKSTFGPADTDACKTANAADRACLYPVTGSDGKPLRQKLFLMNDLVSSGLMRELLTTTFKDAGLNVTEFKTLALKSGESEIFDNVTASNTNIVTLASTAPLSVLTSLPSSTPCGRYTMTPFVKHALQPSGKQDLIYTDTDYAVVLLVSQDSTAECQAIAGVSGSAANTHNFGLMLPVNADIKETTYAAKVVPGDTFKETLATKALDTAQQEAWDAALTDFAIGIGLMRTAEKASVNSLVVEASDSFKSQNPGKYASLEVKTGAQPSIVYTTDILFLSNDLALGISAALKGFLEGLETTSWCTQSGKLWLTDVKKAAEGITLEPETLSIAFDLTEKDWTFKTSPETGNQVLVKAGIIDLIKATLVPPTESKFTTLPASLIDKLGVKVQEKALTAGDPSVSWYSVAAAAGAGAPASIAVEVKGDDLKRELFSAVVEGQNVLTIKFETSTGKSKTFQVRFTFKGLDVEEVMEQVFGFGGNNSLAYKTLVEDEDSKEYWVFLDKALAPKVESVCQAYDNMRGIVSSAEGVDLTPSGKFYLSSKCKAGNAGRITLEAGSEKAGEIGKTVRNACLAGCSAAALAMMPSGIGLIWGLLEWGLTCGPVCIGAQDLATNQHESLVAKAIEQVTPTGVDAAFFGVPAGVVAYKGGKKVYEGVYGTPKLADDSLREIERLLSQQPVRGARGRFVGSTKTFAVQTTEYENLMTGMEKVTRQVEEIKLTRNTGSIRGIRASSDFAGLPPEVQGKFNFQLNKISRLRNADRIAAEVDTFLAVSNNEQAVRAIKFLEEGDGLTPGILKRLEDARKAIPDSVSMNGKAGKNLLEQVEHLQKHAANAIERAQRLANAPGIATVNKDRLVLMNARADKISKSLSALKPPPKTPFLRGRGFRNSLARGLISGTAGLASGAVTFWAYSIGNYGVKTIDFIEPTKEQDLLLEKSGLYQVKLQENGKRVRITEFPGNLEDLKDGEKLLKVVTISTPPQPAASPETSEAIPEATASGASSG
ncbi:MAG TPA: hypothetical protein VJA40_02185 [archaeon]|nr:hypothetical protein [archaeon]